MKTAHPPTLPAGLSPLLAVSLLGTTPLTWIPATSVPQPYRQLLVHDHDMTSELASFHGDSISLTVLHCRHHGNHYLREVTLHAATSGAPVEYGLIEIRLGAFPAALHPQILAGNAPLGGILNDAGMEYRSDPQGFFTVPAECLSSVFHRSDADGILYGRYNHLICGESTILARILEILPSRNVGVPHTLLA
jgi:chorismate-pyruvate lyase